jgi:hypothetical protein
MIAKSNTNPILKHFFLDCNNLIKKQNKTNYKTEFSINPISIDEIEKKKS